MDKKFDFKKLLSKVKIEYLVVVGIAIVIMFVAFGSLSKQTKSVESVDQYVETLESKLKNCLSKVNGAGKVEVIISLESGMETVLATQKQNSAGKQIETPIIVNGKTVVLKESYPQICGVVIVSEGAKNLSVRVAILNATCVYLNVPEDKVEILVMK